MTSLGNWESHFCSGLWRTVALVGQHLTVNSGDINRKFAGHWGLYSNSNVFHFRFKSIQ